jgi:hypothetical protein
LTKETLRKCIQDAAEKKVRYHKYVPMAIFDQTAFVEEGGHANIYKALCNGELFAIKEFKRSSDSNEKLMLREIALVRLFIYLLLYI